MSNRSLPENIGALDVFRVSCDNPRPMNAGPNYLTCGHARCVRCDRDKPSAAFAMLVPERGIRSWWCDDCERLDSPNLEK